MVEALLSYFVLFLILLGMLHVYYFFIGQFFADYAALRGARSRAVGFADYLVNRESRINAIGGSGKLLQPNLHPSGTDNPDYAADQFTQEKTLIQRYRMGITWLEYQFWYGNEQLLLKFEKEFWNKNKKENSIETDNIEKYFTTTLEITVKDSDRTSQVKSIFKDYTLPIIAPKREENQKEFPKLLKLNLFFGKNINLSGSASLANHSKVYLED